VRDAAARRPLVAGTPEHRAATHWLGAMYGPGQAHRLSVYRRHKKLRRADEKAKQALAQAQRAGATPDELERLQRADHAAWARLNVRFHRAYRFLPEEWDAGNLERVLGAEPEREQVFWADRPQPVYVRSHSPDFPAHVWVGRKPVKTIEKMLPISDDVVVVHGRGEDGRLPVDTQDLIDEVLNEARGTRGYEVLLLAHDAAVSARELAEGLGTNVYAFRSPVWVSLSTGGAFTGDAAVLADGKLAVTQAGIIDLYTPHGRRVPVGQPPG
jgi:hypothetical protein